MDISKKIIMEIFFIIIKSALYNFFIKYNLIFVFILIIFIFKKILCIILLYII